VPEQQKDSARQDPDTKPKRSGYSAETLGLIILGFVVLLIIVVRYWNDIPWGSR
jgi:hypothetical protein